MKRIVVFSSVILAMVALCQVAADDSKVAAPTSTGVGPSADATQQGLVIDQMDMMPLTFTENKGQWDEKVKFRADAGRAAMWFTSDGVYYHFTRRIPTPRGSGAPPLAVGSLDNKVPPQAVGHPDIRGAQVDHELDSIEQLVIKAGFVGANPDPTIVGEDLTEYKCHYFIGSDPSKWRTDVPNYRVIVLEDIYPGIDLTYYGNGHQIEYDFVVNPGADYSQIQIRYDGAESLAVADDGALVVTTKWSEMRELEPVVYQEIDGIRRSVTAEYVLQSDETFGFRLGSEFDPTFAVTIDPVLVYSTYLGGSTSETGYGIAVDGDGCAYVTGLTASTNFPTENPFQGAFQGGDWDVFVTKLNASGNSLVYSTYLGGDDRDEGRPIAVDGNGCAYVAGLTRSTDFPTQNPYQTDQGDWDAFVTKLSVSGSSLIYSTYLGGSGPDYGEGIAIDDDCCAYVTGRAESLDFPTENPYQSEGGDEAFVTKLSVSGNSLVYSTYLGGSSSDDGYGIAVDGSGCAYVTGETFSTDFPTQNPYQTDQGSYDAFVTKLSAAGNSLVYSTYLGGSSSEYGFRIAVVAGCAYVTGSTHSSDFPTENPYQMYQGSGDVFVTKLSATGNSLVYSTYLGGSSDDQGHAFAVDDNGYAYASGMTWSTDFPTQEPYQTDQGSRDVFVTKLSRSGSSLIYSTYLGGSSGDDGQGIAIDGGGCAYVMGGTSSTNFPTQDPYQTDQGDYDVFVTKLCGPSYVCGDADASGEVDIDDVVYLIAFIFSGGPPPDPYESGDADCSGDVDIDDVVYLIAYIFSGSPAPCDPDGDQVPDC